MFFSPIGWKMTSIARPHVYRWLVWIILQVLYFHIWCYFLGGFVVNMPFLFIHIHGSITKLDYSFLIRAWRSWAEVVALLGALIIPFLRSYFIPLVWNTRRQLCARPIGLRNLENVPQLWSKVIRAVACHLSKLVSFTHNASVIKRAKLNLENAIDCKVTIRRELI